MKLRTALTAAVAGSLVLTGCSMSIGEEDPATANAVNQLPDGSEDCTVMNLVASSEKAALLGQLANEYNEEDPRLGSKCARVQVFTKASGAAAALLASGTWDAANEGTPKPDVWSPAATTWLRIVAQNADGAAALPQDTPSIAQTPLVIAMPKPMAEALGWPEEKIGWGDILALSTSPEGWGSLDHPEWGPFKLGKTNPNFSTSGLHATVGAYLAATGQTSDLSVDDLADPAVQEYVKGVESSVVHYGDTTLTFLTNLQEAEQQGRGLSYISAVAVEEKSVWDYNQGNPSGNPATLGDQPKPRVPLVAIYPEEGTLVSDNPYTILTQDSAKEEIAQEFLGRILSDAGQARFGAAGFRGSAGAPTKNITMENGLIPSEPALVLAPPNPQVLAAELASWRELRKSAAVMLVVDTSGSMADGNKIGEAKAALLESLQQFNSDDAVGLAEFSDTYRELVPVAPLGEGENRERLERAVENLFASGGTALYRAGTEAVESVIETADPKRINAVVILSDGENTEEGSLEELGNAIGSSSEAAPIRVFTIGYGTGADMDTLRGISETAGAAAYQASDPKSIQKVLTDVISNF